MNTALQLDSLDRQIINSLQGGFPIVDKPYKEVASWFGISQKKLLKRLQALLDNGAFSRFGPLYNSETMGGDVTLAALSVPQERFEEVTELVNAHREVAHNYARDHHLNMWFVIASDSPHDIERVLDEIAAETGLEPYNCPKEKEFFIGLRFEL